MYDPMYDPMHALLADRIKRMHSDAEQARSTVTSAITRLLARQETTS